ncbi:MAG: protein translocase subunit SecD [bacterium]|nr:protein translocase subunit SecD [bacterium]
MRNKGFFWFLTILMTVICIYQLSFTFVANGVEKEAEKKAEQQVEELFAEAEKNGLDSVVLRYSGVKIAVASPESREIAKADFINGLLSERNEDEVYPVLGTKFKDVKKQSLALGLDLVGGMSITMEISIPGMIENYGRDIDPKFRRVKEAADEAYRNGGDYIEIFLAKNRELNKNAKVAKIMATHKMEGIGRQSSDEDVEEFLRNIESSAMDGVEEIINRRINQFGVAQPNIQLDKEQNRIYVELPGVQDEKTVAEKIGSVANLEFYETWQLGEIGSQWQEILAKSQSPLGEEVDDVIAVDDSTSNEEDMVDTGAEADSTDTLSDIGDDISLDDLDGGAGTNADGESKGPESLLDLIIPMQNTQSSQFAFVSTSNRAKVMDILGRSDLAIPGVKFMFSEQTQEIKGNDGKKEQMHILYAIKVPQDGAKLTGKDIANASDGFDGETGDITVNLQMTDEGAEKWAQMTTENAGRQVAITLDNVVYSAPNVNEPIRGGNTQISGGFSIEEAQALAGLLNAGALPAPCEIIEQSRVGPTIGAENSQAGLMSFIIALLLVFVYMIFYYGKAGIIADIALFANILFIFGSLASFGAVLTLAGIAGIVLTIGMAVDANVLIFERVREEQAAGKDIKSAIDTGFKKALSSIIDANVTTMLTAIVLKSFGQGPIESFATTLIIGIFTSVFAALVITRLFMTWWMNKGKSINFESKVTKNAFKNFNINFIDRRKTFYIVSAILVAGSVAMIATRGFSESVEFSGGRTYGVKFEKEAESHIDALEANLKDVLVDGEGKTASVEIKKKDNSLFLEISTNYLLDETGAEIADSVKQQISKGLTASSDLVGTHEFIDSRSVSNKLKEELASSSTIAIILSLIIIFGYILMRFGRWQYSTGAIIAMMHDVTIVLGIFAAFHGILPFNMDIDQAFIAAILTVIGYSINDTVIVFDRIRENLGLHKSDNEQNQINRSLNSTLSRTINTSMTTFIVLLIIFIFGGAAIKGFIFALMIGVIVGTYSSVCIATPVLIDFSGMKKAKKKSDNKEVAAAEA